MNLLFAILLSTISGLLLCMGFPLFEKGFFAWGGLVPLMWAITNKSAKSAFFLSFICGIVFFLGIFNWILEIPKYKLLHHALLALYLGAYFGIFGMGFSFIAKRCGAATSLFAAPFMWVSLEFVRSNFFFLTLPWGLLAHSQYSNSRVIQMASFTGAYGISFLIVMVNAAIASIVLYMMCRLQKNKATFETPVSRQAGSAVVVTASILLGLTMFYGHRTVSRPIAGDAIKLSVVQGNIEQVKKWDQKYAKYIMNTYAELTQKASVDQPALIIWPETAVPGAINRNARLYKEVSHIVEEAQTCLLLGSSQQRKFKSKGPARKYLNSAFLIGPDQRQDKTPQYDKIRLLPFGEYLPFKETIPWSYIHVPDLGGYTPGSEFTVFELPNCRFGVTICWENIFPDLVRKFVKNGAQLIVNITNEAWFGKTAAPYQFLSMSVFRAVENRVFVVRCANTGVSCFIDPYGRIVSQVKDENGSDIFVRGVLTDSVIPLKSKTFYTQYGDWLAWMCTAVSVVFVLFALFKSLRLNVK